MDWFVILMYYKCSTEFFLWHIVMDHKSLLNFLKSRKVSIKLFKNKLNNLAVQKNCGIEMVKFVGVDVHSIIVS